MNGVKMKQIIECEDFFFDGLVYVQVYKCPNCLSPIIDAGQIHPLYCNGCGYELEWECDFKNIENFNPKEIYTNAFQQAIKEIDTFKKFEHIRDDRGHHSEILRKLKEFLENKMVEIIDIKFLNIERRLK